MGFFNKIFKRKKQDPSQALKEMLENYELPSFPKSVMKVLELLREPDAPISDISKLIEADPGMHVTVLKTVNSAAFGLSRKIGNIQHAISLLGRNRLESIILPIAVKNAVPRIELYCLNQQDFWKISAMRACLAKAIAGFLHPTSQAECFTAGLLQDMAVPVLLHIKEQKYCMTLETWNEDKGVSLEKLERETFGLDHQGVGALMAEKWQFPQYLLEAILYHHSTDGANTSIPKAVTAVSQIRYRQELAGEACDDSMLEILRETLDVSSTASEKILEKANREASEFYSIFSG